VKHQEHITKSPIADANLIPFLNCKDYTVSGEEFSLLKDAEADFLITSPRPLAKNLMTYYESNNYISHTDKNITLFDKVYQKARFYTTKSKVKKISKIKKSIQDVLDVGCGTGNFLNACLRKKWRIFGVEPHNDARVIAQQKTKSNNFYNSFETLEQQRPKQKFDVITLWHVLEHVPNLDSYIQSLKKLLKPNGVLIIAVPNFLSFDAQYYKSFWAAYDVPRHLWHFAPKAIELLFKKVDLQVVDIWPMIFDSFYISFLSEKNKKGNIIRASFIGFWSNIKALFSKNYSSLTYILRNKAI